MRHRLNIINPRRIGLVKQPDIQLMLPVDDSCSACLNERFRKRFTGADDVIILSTQ